MAFNKRLVSHELYSKPSIKTHANTIQNSQGIFSVVTDLTQLPELMRTFVKI